MKKSLWVMAILLAIGMVFVGCPQVNGPGNPTNGDSGNPTNGLPANVGENPFKGNTYKNDETEYVFTEKEVTYKMDGGSDGVTQVRYTYAYNTETKLLALKILKIKMPGSEDWLTPEQCIEQDLKTGICIYPTEQESRTAWEQDEAHYTDRKWTEMVEGYKMLFRLPATATWTELYNTAYNFVKAKMGPLSRYYSYDISGSTLTLKDYVNPELTLKQYYTDYAIPTFRYYDVQSGTRVNVYMGRISFPTGNGSMNVPITDVTDSVIKTYDEMEIPYTMTPGESPELKVTINNKDYTLSLIPSVEVLKRVDDSGSPSNGDSGSPSNGDSGSPSNGDSGNPTNGDSGNPTNGDSGNPTNGLPENVGENPFKGNTYKNDGAEYVFTEKEVTFKAYSGFANHCEYHYNTETKLLALKASKMQISGSEDWMTPEQYFGEGLKRGMGIYPTEQESRTAAEQAKGSMTDEQWDYYLTGLKSNLKLPATATWTEVYDAAYNYVKATVSLFKYYSYDISGSTLTLKDYVNPELTLKQYYKDYSIPSFSCSDEESHTKVYVGDGWITLPTDSGSRDVRITDVTDTVIKTAEVEIPYTMTPGVSPELKVTIDNKDYTLSLIPSVEVLKRVGDSGSPSNGLPENVGENPFKGNTYKNDEAEYVFTEKEVTYKIKAEAESVVNGLFKYHYNTETKLLALKVSKIQYPGYDWMTPEQYFGEFLKARMVYPTEQESRTAMERENEKQYTDEEWNDYLTGLKRQFHLQATATWTEVYDAAYNYAKVMMGSLFIYYSYDISGSTLTLKDYVNPELTLKQYYTDYAIPTFRYNDEESHTEVYVSKGLITLSTNSDYWIDYIVDVTDTVIKTYDGKTYDEMEIPYSMTPGVSPELKVTIGGVEYTLSLSVEVETFQKQ